MPCFFKLVIDVFTVVIADEVLATGVVLTVFTYVVDRPFKQDNFLLVLSPKFFNLCFRFEFTHVKF